MKSKLVRLGLVALMVGTLASCGGSDGATGATGAAGTPGVPGAPGAPGSNGKDATATVNGAVLTAAQWTALRPTIDPNSITVSINSPPVVTFKVTDQNGYPVVGLGGQSQANGALTPKNYNFFFTLAKLVPGANGEPSKWINYLVTKPVAASTTGAVVNGSYSWIGTYPTPDQEGTLVDNGDGTYQYTFFRDIKQAVTIVNALTDDSTHSKADLNPTELNYDATATHRLGIVIQGSQPGTGTNTPTAVQVTTPVPLVNTFNIGYDFVPAGGAVTATRDIVEKASCTGCHDGKGIGHVSTTSATNGIPAGSFVGRNDPRLCVTCHTDQTKYGFANVTEGTNVDGSPALTSKYYRTTGGDAAFTYPRMIHQTHMGSQLVKTGYNLNGHCNTPGAVGYDSTKAIANLGQCYNLVGFPQDQRDCTKCHDGSINAVNKTADGDNWKLKPSILACGACHDGINFATGAGITLANRDTDIAAKNPIGTTATGHVGGAKSDNSQCTLCHDSTTIPVYHQTNTATPNNPIAGAWKNGRTHVVSTIAYSIKSVTVNSSKQPVITFKITLDGATVTSLAIPAVVTNAKGGAVQADPNFAAISGFVGGPSFYVAYAVPQDGIAAPADFNAYQSVSLANLLAASGSPKGGSLSNTVSGGAYQADANGYYTATLTGDTVGQPVTGTCLQNTGSSAITGNCVNPSPIVIPANATMVTGAMIGTFTQTNVTDYTYTPANVLVNPNTKASGGVIVKSLLAKAVATGYTARRQIADINGCNNCHDKLGTSPEFHGGARNDPTACNICHNANKTDEGWVVNSSTWLHGIHGASERTVPFTAATTDWSAIQYPGILKDCNQCHLPNTVNFGVFGATVQPNLLWPTSASGVYTAPAAALSPITGLPTANNNTSPYLPHPAGWNYGTGFTFTPEGSVVASYTTADGSGGTASTVAAHVAGAGGEIVPAQNTSLVNSPIASACSACHDTGAAQAHMKSNGGHLYEARSTAMVGGTTTEACLVCHGQGAQFDAAVVHQQ